MIPALGAETACDFPTKRTHQQLSATWLLYVNSPSSHPVCAHHFFPQSILPVRKMAFYNQGVSRPAVPLIKSIQPPPYQSQQQGYLPNGNSATGPTPGAQPLLPHNGRIIQQGATRVLCIADVRGRISDMSLQAMTDG